jgi:hypothetical protein
MYDERVWFKLRQEQAKQMGYGGQKGGKTTAKVVGAQPKWKAKGSKGAQKGPDVRHQVAGPAGSSDDHWGRGQAHNVRLEPARSVQRSVSTRTNRRVKSREQAETHRRREECEREESEREARIQEVCRKRDKQDEEDYEERRRKRDKQDEEDFEERRTIRSKQREHTEHEPQHERGHEPLVAKSEEREAEHRDKERKEERRRREEDKGERKKGRKRKAHVAEEAGEQSSDKRSAKQPKRKRAAQEEDEEEAKSSDKKSAKQPKRKRAAQEEDEEEARVHVSGGMAFAYHDDASHSEAASSSKQSAKEKRQASDMLVDLAERHLQQAKALLVEAQTCRKKVGMRWQQRHA